MANVSCVKWDNFEEYMVRAVHEIFENHQYTDCRLVVPGGELWANRAILCTASRFFASIFTSTKNMPTMDAGRLTVLIPDLKLSCLRWVLQFIYTGEVYLQPHDVEPFLEACRFLEIRGVPYNKDPTVEINLGTFINPLQEVSTADSNGSEATENFVHGCRQEDDQECDVAGTDERVNALKAENETENILYEEVELGEPVMESSSSMDYPMENEDSDPTFPDLLNEALEAYEARLNAAIDAIVNRGVSYRIASQQSNISKTVLWRRTMRMPRMPRPTSPKLANQRSEAIDALKSGEKLLHVSQRFEIPLSTLHRDKIRLYKKGILPGIVTTRKRDKSEHFRQRLVEAVNECLAGRMSLSEAARVYDLPKTSIWRNVRSSQAKTSGTDGKDPKQAKWMQNSRQLNATLQDGSACISNRNMDVSGTELTQDSIILGQN
uniref:BTB domain-containing protein n=1 Tax=Anopheles culicifacies TaxID=139723 RepID=A0A182LUA3_9DIPT